MHFRMDLDRHLVRAQALYWLLDLYLPLVNFYREVPAQLIGDLLGSDGAKQAARLAHLGLDLHLLVFELLADFLGLFQLPLCFRGLQLLLLGSVAQIAGRSEEHTSELQSRPHLVCRLLLEKKKRNNTGMYPSSART